MAWLLTYKLEIPDVEQFIVNHVEVSFALWGGARFFDPANFP